jgi:hypothetical protein
MIKLRDNPVFKKDHFQYQQDIKKVTDENLQQELISLLTELVNEVNTIDLHHDALLLTGTLPEATKESRTKLASIKKKLDTKLSSYRSRQQSS